MLFVCFPVTIGGLDGSKIVIPSPNLFDAVVLSFDNSANISKVSDVHIKFDSFY